MEHSTSSQQFADKVRAALYERQEKKKAAARMKIYPDGQFVALEQRQCVVCGKLYETGNLLMDTRFRNDFENRHACTGLGMCPEHQKYVDDGYVICLEVSNQPGENGDVMRPEEAERTGNICFIKKEAANEIFDMPIGSPVVYFQIGVIEKLKSIFKDAVQELDTEGIGVNAEADCESAV